MSCPDCFTGHVHDGTPRGKVVQLHGLDTYVSEPTNGKTVKGIIVIIPDAFGWVFVNNRLLADHFAEKGNYRVYLPDFMKGHSAPAWGLDIIRVMAAPGFSLSKIWNIPMVLYGLAPTMIFARIGRTWPFVRDWFAALRNSEAADLPVGAAGYCWGGKHVALLAADKDRGAAAASGRPLIDAGFTAHPSMLDLPADINAIKLPVSFAVGDKDIGLTKANCEEIKRIVEAKPEKERGEMKIYEGCGHGFAVRADVSVKEVARQAGEAEHQCLDWFNGHFGI